MPIPQANLGSNIFWAHSDPTGLKEYDANAKWQPLAQHLREVGRIAEKLAKEARPEDIAFQKHAYATGMLHDIGKYAASFQRMIRSEIPKDPGGHAARGAVFAWIHPRNTAFFSFQRCYGTMPGEPES